MYEGRKNDSRRNSNISVEGMYRRRTLILEERRFDWMERQIDSYVRDWGPGRSQIKRLEGRLLLTILAITDIRYE